MLLSAGSMSTPHMPLLWRECPNLITNRTARKQNEQHGLSSAHHNSAAFWVRGRVALAPRCREMERGDMSVHAGLGTALLNKRAATRVDHNALQRSGEDDGTSESSTNRKPSTHVWAQTLTPAAVRFSTNGMGQPADLGSPRG